jgi:para-aminobenzoate synthetase component I
VISRPKRGGFEEGVRRSVERIRAGEIFQVNLCRRIETALPAAKLPDLYRRLRAASPAEHGAFFDLGEDRALLSVSPELFLSVRDGEVETKPIKGTRARGATPREDRALARELAESVKDRAELTMIVDVARNDLGRVCEPGSIEVLRHAEVLTLPTLHHTVSTVRGRLPPGGPERAVDLLRAAFPPASITGAPKIRAMTVAAREEEVRRGPAMGAFGWISLAGDLELAVAIRTAVAARGKVAYHAGCGIVVDSDPELEHEESAVKARAFLTALGAAEIG